jgi:hypothetical protein
MAISVTPAEGNASRFPSAETGAIARCTAARRQTIWPVPARRVLGKTDRGGPRACTRIKADTEKFILRIGVVEPSRMGARNGAGRWAQGPWDGDTAQCTVYARCFPKATHSLRVLVIRVLCIGLRTPDDGSVRT